MVHKLDKPTNNYVINCTRLIYVHLFTLHTCVKKDKYFFYRIMLRVINIYNYNELFYTKLKSLLYPLCSTVHLKLYILVCSQIYIINKLTKIPEKKVTHFQFGISSSILWQYDFLDFVLWTVGVFAENNDIFFRKRRQNYECVARPRQLYSVHG